MTSRTSRDGCVLSACSIFINNASLWKTFVLLNVRLCLYIQYVIRPSNYILYIKTQTYIGAVVLSTNYAIVKYNDTSYRSILQFNFAQNIDL